MFFKQEKWDINIDCNGCGWQGSFCQARFIGSIDCSGRLYVGCFILEYLKKLRNQREYCSLCFLSKYYRPEKLIVHIVITINSQVLKYPFSTQAQTSQRTTQCWKCAFMKFVCEINPFREDQRSELWLMKIKNVNAKYYGKFDPTCVKKSATSFQWVNDVGWNMNINQM